MTAVEIGTIVVSLIAALAAWASQRSAAKASVINSNTTSRVEMEKEAYDRARKYDTDTIQRQDEEINDLREKNERLEAEVTRVRSDNSRLHEEISALQRRIVRLEQSALPHDPKEIFHEHPDSVLD